MASALNALMDGKGPVQGRVRCRAPRGFSLTDVLVSIGVIAVLISLLLPSLAPVKETARQVSCRSGIRQIGIGIAMFADDRNDRIPASYWRKQAAQPANTVCLNADVDGAGPKPFEWDGIGLLFAEQYLNTPGIFYCPSHRSNHKFVDHADEWRTMSDLIVGNYQYRAVGPNNKEFLSEIEPRRAALISDSLRTRDEYNHGVGANVLRADLSVYWFNDRQQTVYDRLATADGTSGAFTTSSALGTIWQQFDDPTK